MYTELFQLCGYEPEEIEKETPRADKAFEKAGIGSEDIERAESRVREYFDTTSLGVKKSLKIWMEQFVDLVLAREEGKKIVYPGYPTVPFLTTALNLASEEIYCQTPEIVLDVVMGQIFGKLDPILEAAEAHGMPQGLAMCSLNQARVGGIVEGIVPIPDLLLGTGFFCDQTPKTDDFLHEIYGVPSVTMDGCMDSSWDEFPEISPRRVKSLGAEVRKAADECQEVLGIEITEEVLEQSLAEFSRLWASLFMLWDYLKNDPQPMSLVDMGPLWWAATSPERRAMIEGFDVITELMKELHFKVKEGKGSVEKGAPRVLILCNQATDPRVMRMIEEAGLAVPTTALMGVTKTHAESYVASPYTAWEDRVANILLCHGLYYSSSALIQRYRELCTTWNLDGVLNFYQFSCRAYCVTPLLIKKAIEEDPGIPVLSLEGDMWDTRQYSAEALRTRVETFAAMLKARAAS
jgi:hypothetical protein